MHHRHAALFVHSSKFRSSLLLCSLLLSSLLLSSLLLSLLLAGCSSGSLFTPQTATPTGPYFSEIVFAEDVSDDGQLVNPGSSFPAGTAKVWAYFTYGNLAEGQVWGRLWKKGSQDFVDSRGKAWDEAADGSSGWLSYSLTDTPALGGDYSLTLYLDDRPVREASFSVVPVATATFDPLSPRLGTVQFAYGVTDLGIPAQPVDQFNPGVKKLYGVFSYEHMRNGLPWKCDWYLDGELSATVDLEWDLGGKGSTYCTYYMTDDSAVPPGEYRLDVMVDGQTAASYSVKVLARAVKAPTPASNERVDPALRPMWSLVENATDPQVSELAAWAAGQGLEARVDGQGVFAGVARYDCPSDGGIGRVMVSAASLQQRSWEETASWMLRQVARAQGYSQKNSCACSLAVEKDALSAQAAFMREMDKLFAVPGPWVLVVGKGGAIDLTRLSDQAKADNPGCGE